MGVRPVCVDAVDAVELGELLGFVGRWLDHDGGLAASFRRFVGSAGYGIDELRSDVDRFAFLLGAGGDVLFGEDER